MPDIYYILHLLLCPSLVTSILLIKSSSLSPAIVMFLLHAFFDHRFGLHLLPLFPSVSRSYTMCSSSLPMTWPYHLRHFSVIFSDSCHTLVVPLVCSVRIITISVTPHIPSASSSRSLLAVLPVILLPSLQILHAKVSVRNA